MPRPLNWVRGEGTTKNQRWGLGAFDHVYHLPTGYHNTGLGFALADESPNVLRQVGDIFTTTINDFGDYMGRTGDTAPPVQKPINWLVVGGIGLALVLLLRRR